MNILVILGVSANLALAIGMVLSRVTDLRFWPPGSRDWRWWSYVVLSGVATIALIGVGYVHWNTYNLPRPESLVLGGAAIAIGGIGFIAATIDLGVAESSGFDGKLRTNGYYRYSRNPQIVSLLCITVGAVLVANSVAALTVGTAMAVWFLSMPLAEEPWLKQQYGDEYEAYRQRVPRFVGIHTVRTLIEKTDE